MTPGRDSGIKWRVIRDSFILHIILLILPGLSLDSHIWPFFPSDIMQLSLAILFLSGVTLSLAASRSKRAAYDLPDGAELLVGAVRTTFFCSTDGYYADIDNNCQIFHVCHTVANPDGSSEMLQWSFLCGNQTVFNQFSFTCTYPEDAVPCGSAANFFYLNANIGAGPNVPFHNEADVQRAAAVTPGRAAQPVYRPVAQPRPQPQRPPFRG